ncbi:unnamed protein product, partial [Caenorhabditis auriculariae]
KSYFTRSRRKQCFGISSAVKLRFKNGLATRASSSLTMLSPSRSSTASSDVSYIYVPNVDGYVAVQKSLSTSSTEGNLRKKIRIEWVPHSTPAALTYLGVFIASLLYTAACFIRNYGVHRKVPLHLQDWLDVSCLSRVLVVQWLAVLLVFFSGIVMYRRILMPMYIFLALIATNGTLVLFMIEWRKVYDGVTVISNPTFVTLAVLLAFAVLHNIVYLHKLASLASQKRKRAMRRHITKPQFVTIQKI